MSNLSLIINMEVIYLANIFNKKRTAVIENKIENFQLSPSMEQNILLFNNVLSSNGTLKFRRFETEIGENIKCCVVFLDEMISREVINDNILKPLMLANKNVNINKNELSQYVINKLLISHEALESKNPDEIIGSILYGDSILLIDGISSAIIIDSKGWDYRSVNEPSSEGVVRGPKEVFTESIKVNMSLIRRKIKDPNLKFEFLFIGTKTKTKISICYVKGTANEKILNELKRRLNAIKIDGILDSGYIEELIKDNKLSPFKTVGNSERPDTIAGKLLEGRIAILCDGSPFALTVPYVFMEYFQSSEDYYNSFLYGTMNRILRILGFFLSTSLPALYTALITFHQEMIPTPLFISIISAREGVPFPTILEALIMLLTFEIIREAGIRIPSPIGEAVSIVGALVLGDAAVTAKVISAPIVIVVALTGISAFLLPKMLAALIILRFFLLIVSSILGMFGYIFGIILIFIHLSSIESFGIPYMTYVTSINKYEIQDTAVRAPWWYMYYGPVFIGSRINKTK